MAAHVQDRVASIAGSDRTSGRDIDTIREVEEFSGEPAPSQDSSSSIVLDTSAASTPRAKSSLAKKFAKSLGFHSHKDSAGDGNAAKKAGPPQDGHQDSDGMQNSERGVHFDGQATPDRPATAISAAATSRVSSVSTGSDKPTASVATGNGKYLSPFETAQPQPSGALTEASAFYSPTSSFNSVASSRVPKALSASLDDEGSQMRKSRMAPGYPLSSSGELEQLKAKPSMLDQIPGEDRTVSGILSTKSRHSSAYSVKSTDGMHIIAWLSCSISTLRSSPANLNRQWHLSSHAQHYRLLHRLTPSW